MTAVASRQAKQLVKQLAAQMSGKARGRDQKVRRDSFDVNDRRAQVFRPIGDGTVAGARSWIDDLLKVAKDFDAWGRPKKGARGPLTPYGLTVLEWLCRGNKLDYKTGCLEPAIAWLEKVTGFARRTVVDALKRLRTYGFIDWVRRSQKTDRDKEAGPQREQITNAYFFDVSRLGGPSRLAKRVLQRFRDLRLISRRRAANRASSAPSAAAAKPARPVDPALEEALARLGAKVSERESYIGSVHPRQED